LGEEIDLSAFGLPSGFNSSKGKKVEGNDEKLTSGHITQTNRQYRQYMNRRGGFNKNLEPDKDVGRKTETKKTEKRDGQAASKRGGKNSAPGRDYVEFAKVQ
jgi:hypothetical protein